MLGVLVFLQRDSLTQSVHVHQGHHIESLAELRQIVKNSFDLKEFTPGNREIWENAYEKFQDIAKLS